MLQKADPQAPAVLIVEDHEALRASLRDWVETMVPAVSVRSVASVQQALEALERAAADVVLMDIRLPGMDGIEGTRRIRVRAPGTAVVVLSILDDRAHVAGALDAGAVAFVSKRRMRAELPAVLQSVLNERLRGAGGDVPCAGVPS